MAKDFSRMEHSNRSGNPALDAVSDPARRRWLQGGLGAATAALLAPLAGCAAAASGIGGTHGRIGFEGIPASAADRVVVPRGYVAQVLAPWGEPVGVAGAMPAFRDDLSNSAEEQALQLGMHHDGMGHFALDGGQRGLLVINHEYTDDGMLHPGGMVPWTAEKVRKSQAAHGLSVVEVALSDGRWQLQRPSRFARRITASTPCTVAGPAAGHALLRTADDPAGRTVRGTLNNCAGSTTPWGTYLAGEENFRFYFAGGRDRDADQRRWGMTEQAFFRWPEHDARFDARQHPNEFHRFGWILEVDPMDPNAAPVKRTALGRGAHEGAWVATTEDGRAVVYSGEDARFEYLYKFVSRDRIAPASAGQSAAQANRALLDHGTLYAARFDADGTGRWLPLVHGEGPLTDAAGFADQGAVLVRTRQAADLLGATRMDRPEWLAIDQARRTVYCTLTNNSARGAPGQPGVDAANPRANNVMGQVIRWQEEGDFDSERMRWDHLLLAGDPANTRPDARGNIRGDLFACPDGLLLDARGLLWIQTDAAAGEMRRGEMQAMGNNQMLACDPATGEVRRFLTGPVHCEITGATMAPDGRTLFVNIQHPGEPPSDRSVPDEVTKYSTWPEGGRPRSAVLAIRREDGGLVGT
ncbi:PhoX family phosphatase [Pseudorhodoferax sp. Leaf265]|uniref:PhoX family protein n=1 Tax=Pseudorhodoferax sp. Leaf265 TaxID=1736315 RepID=UPI0006F432D1|nr:PhoX family phosphatase [Pseudorhodoferax sp. Leaf265]KQP05198.1 Tat pathway signal protein [Pseudorhodoferax sp. Leaf265]